jgi:hypothetical protein
VSLYGDASRTRKVAEGKGAPGRIEIESVAGSGVSGSLWIKKPGADSDIQLAVRALPEGFRSFGQWIHSLVKVE